MPAVGAVIAGIFGAIGSAFAAGGFFTTVVGRLLLSVGLSLLQAALAEKPKEPGIKVKVTQTGGTNPLAFVVGKYATAGTHVCPPMSHGSAGDTQNAYLTYVVLLSDVPGATLSRVMINNRYVALDTTPHPDYGRPAAVGTGYAGNAWVKFYDGSQTVADPMLLAKYSTYPERPWTSDMIGRGCCYAIVTFLYNRKRFPGLPRVKFELDGVPLYDPRKDTTVGGSGAHRWADRFTWEQTNNPMVMVYNLKRGVALQDGSVYGGNFPASDLPLASWFTAMNECDLLVSDGASGTEPQFRAGLEIAVDQEPADAIGELLKACTGQVADIGGIWKTRVGPPGTPAFAMTDADIIISKDQSFRPFPNFASSYNGAHATYPAPSMKWEPKEAPPLYNATYEAQDQGQRLVADLNLVAVPYGAQVRRIMYAGIEEERRFRRHEVTLPPDYVQAEPLDAVAWTSTKNGYTSKVFEIGGLTEDVMTGAQRPILRERDSADFSYPGLTEPTYPSSDPVIPAARTVLGFAASGTSIPDAAGTDRRPAISATWTAAQPDVTGIMWEVRIQATGVVVARGSTQDVESGGVLISEGLIASTAYEVRAQPVLGWDTAWTSWIPVTTPATLITSPDIADFAVTQQIQVFTLGPILRSALNAGTTVLTLDMGEIPPGNIWRRGIHFFAKTDDVSRPWEIAVERRRAFLGGAFGPWEATETFVISSTTWDIYADSGNLAGTYDDFEYRLRVVLNFTGIPAGTELLKTVYMTVARATR